jgi:hypothetical protein
LSGGISEHGFVLALYAARGQRHGVAARADIGGFGIVHRCEGLEKLLAVWAYAMTIVAWAVLCFGEVACCCVHAELFEWSREARFGTGTNANALNGKGQKGGVTIDARHCRA